MTRLLLTSAVLSLALTPAAVATPYDVNGDGRQDLVIGLPNWLKTKSDKEVGALVALGSKRDVIGKVIVLTRKALGLPRSNSTAEIGVTVASGHFDGDGRADLALGAPFLNPTGGFVISYGAAKRKLPGRSQVIRNPEEELRLFGTSLVAGELDDNSFADLAHSTSDELELYFGSADSLAESPGRTLMPPTDGPSTGDWPHAFGRTLAVGDVTRDRFPELFTASRGIADSGDDVSIPGRISVSYGTAEGPQESELLAPEMHGGPSSLSTGDVSGDGYLDLVVGVGENEFYGEDDPPPPGAVKIWFGGPDSISGEPVTITQESAGIPGSSEPGDRFGESVAVGFLNRDVFADIVVGAPGENGRAGRITVIRGGPDGYKQKGTRSFRVRGQFVGNQVSLLDMTGDGLPELVALDERGANVLRGRRSGNFRPRGLRLRFSRVGVKLNPDEVVAPVLGRPGSTD